MNKKSINLLVSLALTNLSAAPLYANPQTSSQQSSNSSVSLASMEMADELAFKLLIYASIVEQQAGSLAEVDEDVRQNYETIRGYFLGAVPTSSAVGLAVFLGKSSLEEMKSVLAPITFLAKQMVRSSTYSSEKSSQLLQALYVDRSLEHSYNLAKFSFENIIYPVAQMFGFLINKATLISSGTSSVGTIAGTSIFLLSNSTEEALSIEAVNKLLGQDKAVQKKVDDFIEDMSAIFELSPSDKEALKIALMDKILTQALENEFSSNQEDYDIDILKLMLDQNIIPKESYMIVKNLNSLFETLEKRTSKVSELDQKVLATKVNQISLLSAILFKTLEEKRINDPKTEEQITYLLGSVQAKLSLMGMISKD